jgi:hypothetical protein
MFFFHCMNFQRPTAPQRGHWCFCILIWIFLLQCNSHCDEDNNNVLKWVIGVFLFVTTQLHKEEGNAPTSSFFLLQYNSQCEEDNDMLKRVIIFFYFAIMQLCKEDDNAPKLPFFYCKQPITWRGRQQQWHTEAHHHCFFATSQLHQKDDDIPMPSFLFFPCNTTHSLKRRMTTMMR